MRMVFEEGERAALIAQLGLDDNVDDAALAQAVGQRLQAESGNDDNNDNNDDNALANIPEDADVVVVDVEEFRRLRGRDRLAGEVERTLAVRDRDELIEEAIHDGKISPARREHYRKKYEADPDGTKKLIAVLKANTVPVELRGKDAPTDDAEQADAYPKDWLPEVGEKQAASQEQQQPRRNRVHGESL